LKSTDRVRLGCRNYDGTAAIMCGRLGIPGVEIEPLEQESVAGMFTGMFNGDFDVSEMSLAELIYYTSRNQNEFAGIPVFPSRMFRHGFVFVRRAANIRSPRDLIGRRLGFLRWVQTAAVWVRGMLVDEYGVTPGNSEWYVASLHHWDKGPTEDSIKLPGGATIALLQGAGNANIRALQALADGRLDLLGVTESQLKTLLADSRVKRLFENYRDVEIDYFRKTRIFPIMHVLVVRKTLVDERPELPGQLFELFSRAKEHGQEWQRSHPSLVIAWKNHALEEESRIFDGDPCPYGLERNREVLNKFIEYCEFQGISERNLSPEELFVPSTWCLTE
jgi:4,5-dihydroxyphthalate decarboxylase